MEQAILDAIVQMVKEGGTLAVWGIVAYMGLNILKVAIIGGITWAIINSIGNILKHCWEYHLSRKEKSFNLISDKISQQFLTSLQDFEHSMCTSVTALDGRLQSLEPILSTLETKSEGHGTSSKQE